MMNCSTSALGRCLGMMIPFGKMASFEEVQNRQTNSLHLLEQPKIIVDMPNKEVWPVSKNSCRNYPNLGMAALYLLTGMKPKRSSQECR
jgi:hypothetical protein